MRNRVGLKDRLLQLTAIFLNFNQAQNLLWDIPIDLVKAVLPQSVHSPLVQKLMQKVS